MLPLRSHGQSWGLVEIYHRNDRVVDAEEIETAAAIVARVGDVLAVIEHRI